MAVSYESSSRSLSASDAGAALVNNTSYNIVLSGLVAGLGSFSIQQVDLGTVTVAPGPGVILSGSAATTSAAPTVNFVESYVGVYVGTAVAGQATQPATSAQYPVIARDSSNAVTWLVDPLTTSTIAALPFSPSTNEVTANIVPRQGTSAGLSGLVGLGTEIAVPTDAPGVMRLVGLGYPAHLIQPFGAVQVLNGDSIGNTSTSTYVTVNPNVCERVIFVGATATLLAVTISAGLYPGQRLFLSVNSDNVSSPNYTNGQNSNYPSVTLTGVDGVGASANTNGLVVQGGAEIELVWSGPESSVQPTGVWRVVGNKVINLFVNNNQTQSIQTYLPVIGTAPDGLTGFSYAVTAKHPACTVLGNMNAAATAVTGNPSELQLVYPAIVASTTASNGAQLKGAKEGVTCLATSSAATTATELQITGNTNAAVNSLCRVMAAETGYTGLIRLRIDLFGWAPNGTSAPDVYYSGTTEFLAYCNNGTTVTTLGAGVALGTVISAGLTGTLAIAVTGNQFIINVTPSVATAIKWVAVVRKIYALL